MIIICPQCGSADIGANGTCQMCGYQVFANVTDDYRHCYHHYGLPWICLKCGRVYAPWVYMCPFCGPLVGGSATNTGSPPPAEKGDKKDG